jgi:hypothetical protein
MIPNPIWNKPSRNIVKSLILGSGLPLGDKGGWELEKSLLSISFYRRSPAELSILLPLSLSKDTH